MGGLIGHEHQAEPKHGISGQEIRLGGDGPHDGDTDSFMKEETGGRGRPIGQQQDAVSLDEAKRMA